MKFRDGCIRRWTAFCAPLLSLVVSTVSPAAFQVEIVNRSPQSEFAETELRAAADRSRPTGNWKVTLRIAEDHERQGLRSEGFRIHCSGGDDAKEIQILAGDPAGLLYGGLEVAEVVRTLGIDHVHNETQNPYMALRGTKFNIPLDVRTPSYTDVCDAAQINLPEMWSLSFWQRYIDALARHRYNYVSLWNLHPFPSLVKLSRYPDVALDDVWRSNVRWKENYTLQGRDFVSDEILEDVEVVKRLTIDQKIDFWREVMKYGKSRNVDFYLVTWNIFTYGTDGKYGITDDLHNPTTIDYMRRSVTELFRTYPDLAGIGLTTGENMPGATFGEKEDWAMATYGQGVLDAAAEQPDRKITFIHRQHQANATEIANTFRSLVDHPNIEFLFSFKYAKAHVYSATKQPYHTEFIKDLGELKTIWTLRNDDVYYFRWGAPDFVREFVKNIPYDVSRGYYYGSDQYVWGREFLQRGVTGPRELEIEKHWFQWLLWGRMAYNPNLNNERLSAILASRFSLPLEAGDRLRIAWQNASMIYPITTGFHWGALDFQWYIEGCESRPEPANNETGFHDVNRFISLKPHEKSNCLSIPEFVNDPRSSAPGEKRTPLEVADLLDRHSERAERQSNAIPPSDHPELKRTLTDIRIVARLGAYYADKIRGATQLALYRTSGNETQRELAIKHLADAARHWHQFASLALEHHKNPLWTNRVGYVDWKKNYAYTLDDLRIAGGDPMDFDLPASVDTESVRPSTRQR